MASMCMRFVFRPSGEIIWPCVPVVLAVMSAVWAPRSEGRDRLTHYGVVRQGEQHQLLRPGPASRCRLALVLQDPVGGQRPVPEHPPEQAMAHFLGECGRGDSQHRAPGVGQAVAVHPAADHLGQHAPVACPQDQQVIRVGDGDQDPARLATLDHGLDPGGLRGSGPTLR